MLRFLICGSRTWTDVGIINDVLSKLPKDSVVIHGDSIGVDTIVEVLVKEIGLKSEKFSVTKDDWVTQGGGAGYRNNHLMLNKGEPQVVIAFLDPQNESQIVKNLIELAESYGKRIVIINKK